MSSPHQVHLFKNLILSLKKGGHSVGIICCEKECTIELLDKHSFDYYKIEESKTLVSKFTSFFGRSKKVYEIIREIDPDILISQMSPYNAQMGKLLGKYVITVNDTNHVKFLIKMTMPFSDTIITDYSYPLNHGKNHIRCNSYNELGYLHPKYFKPDETVLEELGIKKGEIFTVLRFISWDAIHDINIKGFSIKSKNLLINHLSKYGRVFISTEYDLPPKFEKYGLTTHPDQFHDVLFFASLYVGEGATSAAEAAVLGTPAINSNPLRMGYTDELEEKYGLLYNIQNLEEIFEKSSEILSSKSSESEFMLKRKHLLDDKEEITSFLKNTVLNIELK